MRDNKLTLSLDSCKPGMYTAEAVFNQYGGVIIWENTLLDDRTIEHLKNMGIGAISVYESSLSDARTEPREWAISHDAQSFNIKYEQDVHNIKKALNDVSSGKRLNKEVTDQIVGELVQKSEENRNIINSIMQVRSIDEYTYYHSLNVSMLSMLISRWLNFDEGFVRICSEAGLLHDVGKAKIPVEILNKPGKLTDAEFAEMKRHPEYGYLIVNDNHELDPAIPIAVLTHHEKEDGSGYPFGLTTEKTGVMAKIIAVADIFDAMTANRVYKYKDTPFKVFELMQHGSFGVLNPQVLNAFLENITNYYIGSKVRLNTGEIGEVVFMNRLDFSKPVIKVDEKFIDLAVSKRENIVEFL